MISVKNFAQSLLYPRERRIRDVAFSDALVQVLREGDDVLVWLGQWSAGRQENVRDKRATQVHRSAEAVTLAVRTVLCDKHGQECIQQLRSVGGCRPGRVAQQPT
jgi:hypothetical protein